MNNISNNISAQLPYSLCIPAASSSTTELDIKTLFQSLGIAKVSRVDIVKNHSKANANANAKSFNRIFIYIAQWETTPNAIIALRHLMTDQNFKIMHQFPQFWRIVKKRT